MGKWHTNLCSSSDPLTLSGIKKVPTYLLTVIWRLGRSKFLDTMHVKVYLKCQIMYKWILKRKGILNKREYLGPVRLAVVWSADDIPFCSIFTYTWFGTKSTQMNTSCKLSKSHKTYYIGSGSIHLYQQIMGLRYVPRYQMPFW